MPLFWETTSYIRGLGVDIIAITHGSGAKLCAYDLEIVELRLN